MLYNEYRTSLLSVIQLTLLLRRGDLRYGVDLLLEIEYA